MVFSVGWNNRPVDKILVFQQRLFICFYYFCKILHIDLLYVLGPWKHDVVHTWWHFGMAMHNYFIWPFYGDALDFMSSKSPSQFDRELLDLTNSWMFFEILFVWNLVNLTISVNWNTIFPCIFEAISTVSFPLLKTGFWIIKETITDKTWSKEENCFRLFEIFTFECEVKRKYILPFSFFLMSKITPRDPFTKESLISMFEIIITRAPIFSFSFMTNWVLSICPCWLTLAL